MRIRIPRIDLSHRPVVGEHWYWVVMILAVLASIVMGRLS